MLHRYAIYEKTANDIKVVEPKAHGLDYLAAPREEKEGEEGNWIVASDEIKQQILNTGIRKLERETRVSHHTIDRILKGESVRRKTLAKIVKQIPRNMRKVGCAAKTRATGHQVHRFH